MKRVAVSLLVAVGLLSAVVEVAPARVAAASDVDLAVDTVTATPPSVLAGETVQVSAVVHNVGPNDATAVSAVVFTLPDGVTLAPGSGCTDAAPEVQCVTTNSLLAGADETVSINVVVDAAPSGAIVVALTGVDDDPDLSNNSGSASIALAPATTGSITGHVVVAGATALSGSITLLTSNTGNYVGSAPIDVTGEYHFANIAFGTYRLQVNAGGLQSRWYPSSPDQGGSSTVTIDAGTPAANNVDVTYPTGSISGTVSFRSSGLGSVNVSIQPVNAIMFGYASMTTDSDGTFIFRGLEPGSYRVQTSSATGSATYGGDTAPLPVVVGAADVTGIDLVVPPGVISGTVVDSSGAPVSSGAVNATLQSYPNSARGVAVVNGVFSVSGLVPGTYRLTYTSNSGAPYTHPIDVTVSDALPDVTGVALALPSPASLQGTVYSAPGVPATNTWVYIYPTSGMAMGIGAVTDENGSYQFTNVSPGSYRIQTTIGTTTYYYPSSPDSSTAQTVAVGSGQTLTGLDISKPSGAISGHIFNGAVGIEGLTVSVTSPTGYPVYATAVTDANGAYTANGLPPGTYRVGVAGPGFSSRYYPSATSTYLGSDVVLTASGPLTGIDITYPTGAVSGTVMYRGAPVSGTTVTVQSFMTMGYYAATTNASGQFTVHGVDPGSYQIRASGAQGSAVWGGEMFPTNVTVASAEVTGIALVIPPGIISGQVIDSMGLPVSQGNVTAQQVGGSFNRSAALVPGGGFTLSGLEVGTYRLQYSLYGANNYTHPTDLTVSAMSPDVTGVQISLALPGTVTGTVYQSAGVPQPNTYVSLATSTSVAMGLSTTTDAGGHYTFTNVAPGSYRVSATIGMTTYYYPNASSQVNATLFTVAGGQTVSGIDISRPAGSISGRITGGTDPVTGSVTIFTQTGMYVMNVGIGANGAYTAGGLDVGTYKVQVNGNGYPSRYYPSTTDLFSATAVAVTAASPAVTGIDISYPSGSVSGTVTRRGAAVSMTAVYAESTSGSMLQFGQVTTDMAGQFTIRGVAPGTYRVRASGMMGAAYFGGGAGTIVTVGTVNVAGIDIVLPPGSISGTVTQANAQPVVSGSMDAYVVDGTGTVTTQSYFTTVFSGGFSFVGLPYGTYELRFRTMLNVTYVNPTRVTINAATPDALGVSVQLPAVSSISGRITYGAGGPPATAAQVSLSRLDGSFVGSQSTNATGDYVFSDLFPGTYFVSTTIGSGTLYYPGVKTIGSATTIALTGGTSRTGIDIAVPAGSISGTIMRGTVPVSGATVSVTTASGLSSYSPTLTDSSGHYVVRGLEVGQYAIRVSPPGGAQTAYGGTLTPSALNITATQPVLTGIDVVLPSGSISGTLLTAAGQPVSFGQVTALRNGVLVGGANVSLGQFTIFDLEPGTYQLATSISNFNALPYTFPGTFILTNASPSITGVQLQQAVASISGTIRTSALAPAGGVLVQLFGNNSPLSSATTAADGTYRFDNLSPGSYRVGTTLFDALGGNPYYYPGVRVADNSSSVTVVSGQPTTGVDITFPVSGTITGRVTGSGGAMVGATVKATVLSFTYIPPVVATTTTNSNGDYTLTGIPTASNVVVQFVPPAGSAASSEYWPNASSDTSAQQIVLGSGQTRANVNAVLDAPSSIGGSITANNTAVSATVYLVQNSTIVTSMTTTMAGTYSFTGLTPGDYIVYASSYSGDVLNSTPYAGTYFGGGLTHQTATIVTLGVGQSLSTTNISLATGATISGRVTGPSGEPLGSVGLNIFPADSSGDYEHRVVFATTAPDGTYTARGLPPGTFKITFNAFGGMSNYGNLQEYYSNAHVFEQAQAIALTAGQHLTGIDAQIDRGVFGTITVRNAIGSVLRSYDTMPRLCPAPNGVETGQPTATWPCGQNIGGYPMTQDPNGTGWIAGPVPPGTYAVKAQAGSGQLLGDTVFLTIAAGDSFTCDLAYPGAGTSTCSIGGLAPTGSVSGTVTGSDGQPIGAVTVTALTSASVAQTTATTTDSNGHYTLRFVQPGTVRIRMEPPVSRQDLITSWYATSGTSYRFDDATAVTIVANTNVANVDARLVKSASGTATVTKLGSLYTTSATLVGLCRAPGLVSGFTCPDGSTAYGSYANNGVATASNLPPGIYTIRAVETFNNTPGPSTSITLAAGDTFTCTTPLDATPICTITPAVVDDGDGVSATEEAGAPGGDGNGDGVPDATQANVTSLVDPFLPTGTNGSNYVTIEVPAIASAPNAQLTAVTVTAPPTVAPPAGVTPQTSFVGFSVANLPVPPANNPAQPPTTVSIDVYLLEQANAYYKYTPATGWVDRTSLVTFAPAATDIGNGVMRWKAIITITDGGLGDEDHTVNGVIVDPGTFVNRRDVTPPRLVCSASSAPTFILNQPGTTVSAAVTDDYSGVASATASATASTAIAGNRQATVTATDRAGNVGSVTCPFKVTYRFDGFREPITSGTINRAKSGQAIPVKWRITDFAGLAVADASSFVSLTSRATACSAGAAVDPIEQTATGTGLSYSGNGTWMYNWKTTGVATGCRTMTLTLQGGLTQTANFEFR